MGLGPERIALVNRMFEFSGSLERITVLLARGLVEAGFDVHCYCDPARRGVRPDGVTFHDVRPLARSTSRIGCAVDAGTFAAAATRALRRDRALYDLIDVIGVAAWEHDVLDVHEVQGAAQRRWPSEAGAAYRAAHTRAYLAPLLRPKVGVARAIQSRQLRPGSFRRIVAVTDRVRDDLVETYGVSPDEIDVSPPPVELAAFPARDGRDRDRVRRELHIAPDDRVLLFVGHAFARKGLDTAIDALPGLPGDVRLVVVGDGDGGRRAFEHQARESGVAERVRFVGSVDPVRYYGAADALVLPTRHDVWGMPLVEAMAAGLPVVTTRSSGGAAEIERARAGVVLDAPDPRELRDALAVLLDQPTLRTAMGERGRAASQRWSVEAHVAARIETYRRAYELTRAPARRRVASVPAVQPMNPYQSLLYAHLAPHGFVLDRGTRFQVRSLLRGRRGVGLLHVHWPEHLYSFERGPRALRGALSWLKLGLFGARLAVARRLGYRIAWTVHQVYPHVRLSPARDRIAARLLARASAVLLVHDAATGAAVHTVLGRTARRVVEIPHGSYVGVYPIGRSRSATRARLGIADDAFVFISFGELRTHKSFPLLVNAFAEAAVPNAVLVVAGHVQDPAVADELRRTAFDNPQVRLFLEYVPDERVAELFGACDAAVVARDDGGTSGSLILPLSLGVPVVAADRPAYAALTGGEEAGWLYRAGDARSLSETLARAAADPDEAFRRGLRALARAQALDWDEIARRTARVFEEALQ